MTMTSGRRAVPIAVRACLIVTLLNVACSGDPTAPKIGPPASLTVSPDSVRFTALTDTSSLVARVQDASGNAITTVAIVWTSSQTAVATVDSAGKVTAAGNGAATIFAAAGAAHDSVLVRVQQIATTVVLSPRTATINALNRQATFTAVATDRNHQAMQPQRSTWTSLSPSIATVDTAGRVTSIAIGSARIIAVNGAVADTVDVTIQQIPAALALTPSTVVVPVGTSTTLAANVVDSGGSKIPVAALTSLRFTSSQTAVTVSDATAGVLSAASVGSSVVRVQDNSTSGLQDSAFVIAAGAGSVVSSSIPASSDGRARVAAGETVRIPILLDLSRVAATGDLGATDVIVRYDPGVLQLDSAHVIAGGVDNSATAGEYRVAYAAATAVSGSVVQLSFLYLKAKSVSSGTESRIDVSYVYAPISTVFAAYAVPLFAAGRVRVESGAAPGAH